MTAERRSSIGTPVKVRANAGLVLLKGRHSRYYDYSEIQEASRGTWGFVYPDGEIVHWHPILTIQLGRMPLPVGIWRIVEYRKVRLQLSSSVLTVYEVSNARFALGKPREL
jgi:hypothetical protein